MACIYQECSIFPIPFYGESDQKLSFLIDLLSELLPQCKFIWLIRNAEDFVLSAVNRFWYSPQFLHNYPKEWPLVRKWSKSRINGAKTNNFSLEEWNAMSAIEKCSWYWQFCNEKIENQLTALPSKRWIQVKLETLEEATPDIIQFLGGRPYAISIQRQNIGKTTSSFQETPDFEKAIKKWCSKGMHKWYGTPLED